MTTIGRKSGKPRLTPLQYEIIDQSYYIGSARGSHADWYQNILANAAVQIQVQGKIFRGHATQITEPSAIADLLEIRLRRHPWLVGILLRLEGLPLRYTRNDLERCAEELAYVKVDRLSDSPGDGVGE